MKTKTQPKSKGKEVAVDVQPDAAKRSNDALSDAQGDPRMPSNPNMGTRVEPSSPEVFEAEVAEREAASTEEAKEKEAPHRKARLAAGETVRVIGADGQAHEARVIRHITGLLVNIKDERQTPLVVMHDPEGVELLSYRAFTAEEKPEVVAGIDDGRPGPEIPAPPIKGIGPTADELVK